MRKELSDLVKIKVLFKKNETGDGPFEFAVAAKNDVHFEENAKKYAAGVLYQQSLLLIITREESLKTPPLPFSFKAIVELSDCEDCYIWGTETVPVIVTVTPRLETVQLDLKRDYPRPLFPA